MKKIIYAAGLYGFLLVNPAWAMLELSDEELADTQGQALFNLSYLSPADRGNFESTKNIGFYRLGVEAEIAANLNVKKLQLGCGGVNGAGACDIDIDNLSLSGNSNTSTGRVQSDAVLTNPFFEFAIKNPDKASTREVMGFRVSAEKVTGLLTTGTENSATANGINTISGFLRIQSDATGYVYGKTNTLARTLNPVPNANYVVDGVPETYNNQMFANIQVAGLFSGAATIGIKTISGQINIPAMSNLAFTRPGLVINETRKSILPLETSLIVPPINMKWRNDATAAGVVVNHNPVETPVDFAFNVPLEVNTRGGALNAEVTGCSGIACPLVNLAGLGTGAILQNNFIQGVIRDGTANVTINQDLGYIHSLPISSPFYLSLQSEDVRWPGSYSGPNPERTRPNGSTDFSKPATVTDVAKRGWWMSFADPINLGSLDPVVPVDVAPLFPQISAKASTYLLANPATIGIDGLIASLTGGDINVTIADPIDLSDSPLTLTLKDLQLTGQNFAANCYGGVTFC